jgi:protein-tyrosine phosphatase
MGTELYWVGGPWPGRLSIAARPRGGDWLRDEIAGWKRARIDTVLSLLTHDEERDLDLRNEGTEAKAQGIEFVSFPIPDRQVPDSESKLAQTLERLDEALSSGKNVVVHCRQGVGRSGLVAACLLVRKGMSPGAAVESVSAARGTSVPETIEQRVWIDRHAVALAGTK